ncbi:MAG: acyl carrier protein [Acholeplasmataceae bacterium]|nr:acyl carrier protein [Acholeplasmataceae bacterium]HPT89036.1 acyl carrier protein [Bacilli bacterium]
MIVEKVIDIVSKELDINKDKIKLESRLAEDLGADSLDAVELIMALEDEFDIQISDEVAQSIKTIGDIVKYLEQNV